MKHPMMDKSDDEPAVKRARTEDSLEPEESFLAKYQVRRCHFNYCCSAVFVIFVLGSTMYMSHRDPLDSKSFYLICLRRANGNWADRR